MKGDYPDPPMSLDEKCFVFFLMTLVVSGFTVVAALLSGALVPALIMGVVFGFSLYGVLDFFTLE
jgi:hypothetical protein